MRSATSTSSPASPAATEPTSSATSDSERAHDAERAARGSGSQGSLDSLDVVRVSKSFPARRETTQALDDVTLHVRKGQFVSIIGPTGCGKSTLLRIVAGLVRPDSGAVSIFGETPQGATAAKHIGFVPQAPALLPWRSVLDNVRLPFQVNRHAESDEVQHHDPVKVLEAFGLGTVLGLRPSQLSGGMQQRVAIARAFVFDPSILLMDEPFSALDELTRERQRRALLEIWESNQKTVLFVTHSVPEAVALSDTVLVMSPQPGRVQALVPVDLPRPRDEVVETTHEFREVEQRVRQELRKGWPDTSG